MRDILQEVLKQSGNLFTVLKVTGTAKQTKFESINEEKTVFFTVVLKDTVPELEGEFGISNLALLNGLLNFSSYKTDTASFNIKRRDVNGKTIIEQFEFQDSSRTGAVHRLMSPELVPKQVEHLGPIPWDVEFEPDRARLAEFAQLSGLFNEVEKSFSPRIDGTDLVFHVGNDNSSTHRASMIFQKDIRGSLNSTLRYQTSMFMSVMKLVGANNAKISLTSRGVMKISFETPYANYDYFIRSERD